MQILRSHSEKQNLHLDKIPTSLVCTSKFGRAKWRYRGAVLCISFLRDIGSKAKAESEALEKVLER